MEPIKIYLASAYRRKDEMRNVRDYLNRLGGFTVVSRWLDTEATEGNQGTDAILRAHAVNDLEDIDASAHLIMFADPPKTGAPVTGGRHVETGYAHARGKSIVIIGQYENVFSRLWVRADTIQEALVIISARERGIAIEPGREVKYDPNAPRYAKDHD